MESLIPLEKIDRAILLIRGKKVMLDSDLADIYGVKTKRLNAQVKRNLSRFPSDFMFQLTVKEKDEVVANCDHLNKLKHSSINPYAFTEHGAIMLAAILNTPTAVETSVMIVRAFVKLRKILLSHKELEKKIEELEEKYDNHFLIVFEAIKKLIGYENKPRKVIGFKVKNADN